MKTTGFSIPGTCHMWGNPQQLFSILRPTQSLSQVFYLVCGPERSPHLLRTSGAHVRLEVHQATGLCLQKAADPLSRILSTIPALHLQAMHSAVGGDRAIGRDNEEALSIVNTHCVPDWVRKVALVQL